MKKETKAQQFIRLFHYWCGRLKLPKPIIAIRDNRMDCCCAVENWWDKEKICLQYHTRRLGQYDKYVLVGLIFHEIGHLINRLPYNTYKQQVHSEYKAERFALDMMKKYYSKQYKLYCQWIKRIKYLQKMKKKDKLYYDAYKKIKEYRESIKND
jgi:hypothetical protein